MSRGDDEGISAQHRGECRVPNRSDRDIRSFANIGEGP